MAKKDAPEYRWNSGPFQIGLVPQGGVISRIDWVRPDGKGTINLLRPVTDQAIVSGNLSGSGCFPMVPFANRLAFAEFEFDGRIVKVPANRPPNRHAIHGFGCRAVWKIERPTVDSLRFNHKHDDPDSGFVYVAWQEFKVTEHHVTIEIGIRHLGRTPMPYGIGLHPWFPGGGNPSVSFVATECFATDDDMLPTTRTVVDLGRDFSDAKLIRHNPGLDIHYSGWQGEVAMTWERAGYYLHLTASENLSNLQLYIPEDGQTFCVEPVSHVPNVHNRPEFKESGDVTVLDKGETLTGSMTLTPELLARADNGLVDEDKNENDIVAPGTREYSLVD